MQQYKYNFKKRRNKQKLKGANIQKKTKIKFNKKKINKKNKQIKNNHHALELLSFFFLIVFID
jgi:hypothetical protein